MIKLSTLLEKHPDDIDSTSGVIIEHADTILLLKKTEGQWRCWGRKTEGRGG